MATPVVVFIGAPASGKSKVAKRVSELLGVERIDTDTLVVDKYGSIPEIFETQGESRFRQYERDAVVSALSKPAVVSLGGGAVLDLQTQSDLRDVPVVLLTVSEEAVAARIDNAKRPLLRGGIEAWKQLVSERMPIYRELAWITLDTSNGDLDSNAEQIVSWINSGYKRQGEAS